jgi:flagellar basal-body rod modification protein FlgD
MNMTDVTSATTATSTASTTSVTSSYDGLASDKEAFLGILLTQLENQNPLDPVDTTEFTSQLVSYSQLEQLINMNAKLDTLLATQESATADTATDTPTA